MNREVPIVLVTGGLHTDVDPHAFWERTGVAPALRALGWVVHLPHRAVHPASWDDEATALGAAVVAAGAPVAVVAASNGCSAALRLAVDHPDLVDRLVLCWPATGDDPDVDRRERARLADRRVDHTAVDALLDGEAVRGVRPDELRGLHVPTVLVPADPEDDHHQRRTVAELRRLLPRSAVGLATPPAPHPGFAAHLGALVALLDVTLTG